MSSKQPKQRADSARALLDAVQAAQGREALREAFWKALAFVGVKYLLVVQSNTTDDGATEIAPVLENLPVGVSLDGLKMQWPNLAEIFHALLEGKPPFDINATTYDQSPSAAWPIFSEVFRLVETPYCFAIPANRNGLLRGGAFFMSDNAFDPAQKEFLRALCAAGHERLVALNLLPEFNPLTARQREVLAQCAQGKSDWEIAQLLDISPATAHEHIEAAKKRLGVRTRVQAAVLATQKGWI